MANPNAGNSDHVKSRIKQVLDTLTKMEEAQRELRVCLAQNAESDLMGVDEHAEAISRKLYAKLVRLTRILLTADGVENLSLSEPHTDKGKETIKKIAGLLIGASAREAGQMEFREEGMQGMLTCIREWVFDRASTAGQQVTALCDGWIRITTVLLSYFVIGAMLSGRLTPQNARRYRAAN